MRLCVLFMLALLLMASYSIAQNKSDLQEAWSLYKKTATLLEDQYSQEAKIYLNKIAPVFKRYRSWHNYYDCQAKLAYCLLQNAHLNEADTLINQALQEVPQRVGKESVAEARLLTHRAHLNYLRSYYKQAVLDAEKSLSLLAKHLPSTHPEYGKVYYVLGLNYMGMHKFPKSLYAGQKAVKIFQANYELGHKELSLAYNLVGNSFYNLAKIDSAYAYLQKAAIFFKVQPAHNHCILAHNYADLGLIYRRKQAFKKTEALYLKSLNLQKQNFDRIEPRLLGITYFKLAQLYCQWTSYQKGLEFNLRALNIFQAYGENTHCVAEAYIQTAYSYFYLKVHTKGHKFLQKGLQIYGKLFSDLNSLSLDVYRYLGFMHMTAQNTELAITYCKKAQALLDQEPKTHPTITSENCYFLSVAYLRIGNTKQALFYINRSLKEGKHLYPKQSLNMAARYNQKARIFLPKKDYQLVEAYLKKALVANLIYFEDKRDILDISFLNNLEHIDSRVLIESILLVGILLEGKGELLARETSNSPKILNNYYQATLGYCQIAEKIYKSLSEKHKRNEDRVTSNKLIFQVYQIAIRVNYKLFQISKDPKYLSQAFYFMEKNKANSLSANFQDVQAKKISNIPTDLIEQEKKLRAEISFYRTKVLDTTLSFKEKSAHQDKYLQLNRAYEDFIKQLEVDYPDYYGMKYNQSLANISQLQAQLQAKQSFLHYSLIADELYIFLVQKDYIKFEKIPLNQDIRGLVSKFQESISKNDIKQYHCFAWQLHHILLRPIAHRIQNHHLIISPSDVIWHIPFDVLLTQPTRGLDYRKLPYLLHKHPISYTYSATLFLRKQQKENTFLKHKVLAFAFDEQHKNQMDKIASLRELRHTKNNLPGSLQEIKAIANLYNGIYYYGSEANEANFKEVAQEYSILHLALHGESDQHEPHRSRLYFKNEAPVNEDGTLYAFELSDLSLNTELAVLSACNTGNGKIVEGEGMMSLGQAFSSVGVKSLLLSHWEVADGTSPKIMTYFYQALKRGLSKVDAIREAKLKYLDDVNNIQAAPFYWGGFHLLGNTQPISEATFKWTYFLLAFTSCLSLITLLFSLGGCFNTEYI